MIEKIEAWYREAASLHGDDWANVETYVARKLAAISTSDHVRLSEEMRALLGNKTEILH